jgi:hypothetical protein
MKLRSGIVLIASRHQNVSVETHLSESRGFNTPRVQQFRPRPIRDPARIWMLCAARPRDVHIENGHLTVVGYRNTDDRDPLCGSAVTCTSRA